MQSWFSFSKHDKMFSVTYGIAVVLDVLQRMKAWAYGKEKIRGAERNLPDFFGLCPTSHEQFFCGTN
jgi:hypothetical protein